MVALGELIPVSNQTNSGEVRGTYYCEQDLEVEEVPFWETDWFLWLVIILMVLAGVSVGVPVFRRGREAVGDGVQAEGALLVDGELLSLR